MQHAMIQDLIPSEEENPIVGQLASRLVKAMENDTNTFGDESLELVNKMLNYATQAEQIIAQQRQRIGHLESLSVTDPLTGLLNRRGFEESLRLVLSNARRYLETGMMAYVDLDNFKEINDQYGHEAGDEVLRAVATKLRQSSRRTDYVARIGGDEFSVVFVRADQVPTRARAIEVRRSLNPITVNIGTLRLDVHASFGLEQYGPTTTSKELLRRADRSMYKDKSRK
jgi:diguanylate cyclase (GGDEF)-like protein